MAEARIGPSTSSGRDVKGSGRDGVKVSVVVPVFNAGAYLQPCIDSLLGQSLTPDELELIFVDDGSTDDSLDRLRALEVSQPNVRVITIPGSGWPGRPRNVGTDAARGEYVMYVDQDDVVEAEALERMHTLGSSSGADVILGKVISNFRGVHHYLYRESRARCTIYDSRLMSSQTPHKMLRTDFLRTHAIRFPEGRRRLEDQLFITRAYFAASSASIVGDYICYRYLRRSDFGNAGSHRIDPLPYYQNLREVLDVVEAHTEPGDFRNRCYRRFLKTEMLSRLGGRKLFNAPADHRPQLLAEIRRLMQERFAPEVSDGLPAILRARAALVRTGTLEDLVAYAERMTELRPRVTLTRVALSGADLEVDVAVEFSYTGQPLRLEPSALSETGWLLPSALVGAGVTPADRAVEPLSEMMADVVIRHREDLDEWFLPSRLTPVIERGDGAGGTGGRLRWRGTAVLQPDVVAGGTPLRPGIHDLLFRVDAFGINRTVRFGAERSAGVGSDPIAKLGETRAVLYTNRGGNLSVKAATSRAAALRAIGEGARLDLVNGRLRGEFPVAWPDPPEMVRVRLTAAEGGRTKAVSLHRAASEPNVWTAPGTALTGLTGRFNAEAQVPGLGRMPLPPLTLAAPPTQRAVTLLARGLRGIGRRLPEPLARRLARTRVARRLRQRERS